MIGPTTHLTADHIFALLLDIDTPIQDRDDVDRLLPYDIFQHPSEDLLIANVSEPLQKQRFFRANLLVHISFVCGVRSLAHGLVFRNEICTRMLQASKYT